MGFSSKTGISLASGFKYQAKSPLDLRRVVDTVAERDELVTINAAWEGMHVYVKTDKKTYEYRGGTTWTPVLAGSMYTHPTYTAKSSGLYKITVDGTGHVSATTAVTKSDITALGIPGSDTKYGVFKAATADAAGGTGLVPAPAKGAQGLFLRGDNVWAKPTDTTYNDATTSAHGLMTAADKTKLDGIAAGANKYTHPGYTAKASGLYKVTVDASGHVSAATAVTKADITALGIPAQDTNTTYNDVTTSAHGLMTAADKTKLDGIAAGANKYTHPGYTAKASGLYKVTVDASGHVSAATAVTKADITALGIPAQDTNTTYNDVTTSAHGLMTAADKVKLNGIATNANNYTHPTSSGNKHIPSGGSSGKVLRWSADGTAVWGDVPSDAISITRVEYNKLLANNTYDPNKYYYVTDDFDSATIINDSASSTSTAYSSSKTNALLGTKVNKSSKVSATMNASSWSGSSAPYTITLSINGVTTSNNVEILIPGSATNAQVEAWMAAGIVNGTQAANSVTLKAYGDKPSINIPIEAIIRND